MKYISKNKLWFSTISTLVIAFAFTGPARADFVKGDIFASVGNGKVNIFSPSGTFIQQLDDTTGASNTTGMTFDNSGNLYVTNFGSGSISKFDVHGNLTNPTWASGLTNTPESIVFNHANTAAYVGGALGGNIVALEPLGKSRAPSLRVETGWTWQRPTYSVVHAGIDDRKFCRH